MILTATLAITLTVALTAYASSRGRSPLLWGGASALITLASTMLAWTAVQVMGSSDLVFSLRGGGLAMLMALAGPVLALLGNGALASRLASLPLVRATAPSSWMMWRVGDRDNEGCECQLSANADAIVGTRGDDELFCIPHTQLTSVDVDGETLLLRVADGRLLRLILANGDPQDRGANVDETQTIKRVLERLLQSETTAS